MLVDSIYRCHDVLEHFIFYVQTTNTVTSTSKKVKRRIKHGTWVCSAILLKGDPFVLAAACEAVMVTVPEEGGFPRPYPVLDAAAVVVVNVVGRTINVVPLLNVNVLPALTLDVSSPTLVLTLPRELIIVVRVVGPVVVGD